MSMTSHPRHRVCQIGCSPSRGRDHLLGFVANPERFEVVAVCDLDAGRRDRLADEAGVAHRYGDAERMLAEQRPDVLCFVTPPSIRRPLIELGIRHRVKAIAYEKPMAEDWPEAAAIRRMVRAAGIKTIQSHQHKYGPHWRRARELIAGGAIGEVRSVQASSKGWLLHYVSHLLDYSMFLVDRYQVAWVAGHAHGRGRLTDNPPSPDYVHARYAFADGLPGAFECGTLAPNLPPGGNPFWFDAGVTVLGSRGVVQVVSESGLWAQLPGRAEPLHEPATFDPAHDQPLYLRDLADWLDDPAKVHPCDGERACHQFEIGMAACLSAVERTRIDLPLADELEVLSRLRAHLPASLARAGAAVGP